MKFKRRMTKQRKAILEELKKMQTHPTAEELYRVVKKRLPKISLGTIYRNLDVLSTEGLIKKIHHHSGQKRYDGNMSNHFHFVCVKCGELYDIHEVKIFPVKFFTLDDIRFDIEEFHLEFRGTCPKCQAGN